MTEIQRLLQPPLLLIRLRLVQQLNSVVELRRSMAVRLETEAAELRRNLRQAVDHKLKAERERQDALDQVNKYTPELCGASPANNMYVFV